MCKLPGLVASESIDSTDWKPSDQGVAHAVREWPVVGKYLIVGNAPPTQLNWQLIDTVGPDIEHGIVTVPPFDSCIVVDPRPQIIDCDIVARCKMTTPVFERLLIDVVLTALSRHRSRKQDYSA